MKHILALLLIFIFIFSLSSCVAKPTEIPTNDPEPEEIIVDEIEEISEEEPINVAVFWCNYEYEYLDTVREKLNSSLDELDVTYTNYDAAGSPETQSMQVDEAIANGANLLIINIVDTAAIEAAQAIVDKAKAADIPVIFFDRWVDSAVLETYDKAFQVFHDGEPTAITKLAEVAADYVVANYDYIDLNNDGKITFITFRGTIICNCQKYEAFQLACNEALAKIGKPELVYYDPQNTEAFDLAYDWSRTVAFERMEEVLSERPMDGDAPIEIVFANGDILALGAIEALNNVGWNTGDSNSIPVFGFNGSTEAYEAVEAGIMTGTNIRSYDGICKAIIELINILTGKDDISNNTESNQTIYVPYEIIT